MTTPLFQSDNRISLDEQHDAAWERYIAAEQAIRHDHSPAAQREYNEAAKQLQYVRNLFFVASLGAQS